MTMRRNRATGVLLCAGRGLRFGGKVAKQYVLVNGKPIFMYALESMFRSRNIGDILVVVDASKKKYMERMLGRYFGHGTRTLICVVGGEKRQQSISNALVWLRQQSPQTDLVVFHDSVRPLVSPDMFDRVVDQAFRSGAAIVGVKGTDLVVGIRESRVEYVPLQADLFQTQTPECYVFNTLYDFYEQARKISTLENATNLEIMLYFGHPVDFVLSDSYNLKLTVPSDYLLIRKLLSS